MVLFLGGRQGLLCRIPGHGYIKTPQKTDTLGFIVICTPITKEKVRQFDKFTPKKLLMWQVKNLLRKLKTITSD